MSTWQVLQPEVVEMQDGDDMWDLEICGNGFGRNGGSKGGVEKMDDERLGLGKDSEMTTLNNVIGV